MKNIGPVERMLHCIKIDKLKKMTLYYANGQDMLMLKSPSWGLPFTDIEFKISVLFLGFCQKVSTDIEFKVSVL